MKIGIDAKWYFRGPVSGRIVQINILPHLFSRYTEHQWFVFLDEKDKDKHFPFSAPNIQTIYVRVPTNLYANLFILPVHAKRLKIDTVLFQTFPGIGRGFRSVALIFDVLFKRFPQYFTWKERLYFIPLPFLTRKADRIVTISEFVKKELVNYRYIKNASRIDVAYLAVNKVFKPLEEQDAAIVTKTKIRYDLPAEFILIVGRLNARKNIESLMRAMPLLDDLSIPLVIAGEEDWKKPDFLKLMEDPAIRSRIRLTGSVDDGEMASLFALAKIFCFPSFAEGFGLPPLEAMASGVPVVVSNTTSLPEICGDAVVYADPQKPKSIADGINRLLGDPILYQQKKREGLVRAAEFTWTNTADKLMESIIKSAKQ